MLSKRQRKRSSNSPNKCSSSTGTNSVALEILSLVVLACALAVKFFTTKHTESLEAQKIKVDNEHRRLKAN